MRYFVKKLEYNAGKFWLSDIKPSIEDDELLPDGFEIMTKQEINTFLSQNEEEYNAFMEDYKAKHMLRLRYFDLIHDNFKHLDDSKVDFTVHLKSGINLIKKIEMLPNGRPIKAKYYYETFTTDKLISEIKFDFFVNSMNFMTRRTESLGHYTMEGLIDNYYIISDKSYDFSDIREATISVQERTEARSNIMSEIKTFLNGVLMQYYTATGKTYIDVMNDGGAFWKEYLSDINSWVETANIAFKNKLIADNTNTILNIPVGGGLTVRDYMVNRISY